MVTHKEMYKREQAQKQKVYGLFKNHTNKRFAMSEVVAYCVFLVPLLLSCVNADIDNLCYEKAPSYKIVIKSLLAYAKKSLDTPRSVMRIGNKHKIDVVDYKYQNESFDNNKNKNHNNKNEKKDNYNKIIKTIIDSYCNNKKKNKNANNMNNKKTLSTSNVSDGSEESNIAIKKQEKVGNKNTRTYRKYVGKKKKKFFEKFFQKILQRERFFLENLINKTFGKIFLLNGKFCSFYRLCQQFNSPFTEVFNEKNFLTKKQITLPQIHVPSPKPKTTQHKPKNHSSISSKVVRNPQKEPKPKTAAKEPPQNPQRRKREMKKYHVTAGTSIKLDCIIRSPDFWRRPTSWFKVLYIITC